MRLRTAFDLLKATYGDWSEDKASRLAAALAYYTAFAIAPLLLIAIAVAGLVFGEEAARGQVFAQLEGLLGAEAAQAVQTAVANSQQAGVGTISAIIGLATLLWSASNVFAQLQDALNTIWEVAPKPGAGIVATIKKRFLSMTMVLGTGFLLLVSLLLSSALAVLGNFFSDLLPGAELLWEVVNFGISFAVITLLFAAIYKVLPDVRIAWGDVWIGAAATGLLFVVGKLLIGLYLGNASVGSTYGAAGSLLVLLIWIYYAAQILFFGAEFTQAYARTYGTRLAPTEDAVPVTEEARAKQGIPRKETVERAAQAPAELVERGTPAPTRMAARAARAPADAARRNGKPAAAATGYQKPEVVKKLLWMGLVSGSHAATGLLAHRAGGAVWKLVMREPPPTRDA